MVRLDSGFRPRIALASPSLRAASTSCNRRRRPTTKSFAANSAGVNAKLFRLLDELKPSGFRALPRNHKVPRHSFLAQIKRMWLASLARRHHANLGHGRVELGV